MCVQIYVNSRFSSGWKVIMQSNNSVLAILRAEGSQDSIKTSSMRNLPPTYTQTREHYLLAKT